MAARPPEPGDPIVEFWRVLHEEGAVYRTSGKSHNWIDCPAADLDMALAAALIAFAKELADEIRKMR